MFIGALIEIVISACVTVIALLVYDMVRHP